MRVVIIGLGWVGHELALQLLQKGHQVIGLSRSPKLPCPYPVFAFNYPTLGLASQVKSGDLVICTIPPQLKTLGKDFYPALLGELGEAFAPLNLEKFILLSSTSVFGEHQGEVTEQTVPAPDSESGKVIWEGEKRLQLKLAGRLLILRLAGLVGPGRDHKKFFKSPPSREEAAKPVNLIHRDDVIQIILKIVEQGTKTSLFNLASDEHRSKNEVYELGYSDLKVSPGKVIKNDLLKSLLGHQLLHPNFR